MPRPARGAGSAVPVVRKRQLRFIISPMNNSLRRSRPFFLLKKEKQPNKKIHCKMGIVKLAIENNFMMELMSEFQMIIAKHSDINHSKGRHSRESRNPEKHWIPPYQVRGRLSQARNDKLHKIYVVMYRLCGHGERAFTLCAVHYALCDFLNGWRPNRNDKRF